MALIDRGEAATARTDSRSALIAAALEAFTTSGYEGASVREIERRAGVNRGLAAYHFKTKLELWRAALDSVMQELLDELERCREFIEFASPPERGRIIVKVYIGFCARRPQFFRALVLEGGKHSARSDWLYERYVKPVTDYFESVSGRNGGSREQAALEHFVLMGAASLIFAAPAQCEYLFGLEPTEPGFAASFAEVVADLSTMLPEVGAAAGIASASPATGQKAGGPR
jgi:TetR/AcrR family transcriptional regulator